MAGLGGRVARQHAPDVGAAARAILCGGLPLVGAGDRVDDCEPQARTAPVAPAVGAAEPLKRASEEALRKPRTGVAHMQLEAPVCSLGAEPHIALAVAEGVVDHVAEGLLQPQAIGARADSRLAFGAQPATRVGSAPGKAAADVLEHV